MEASAVEQSVVVVGFSGSGKTSLCRALVARSSGTAYRFRELPAVTMLAPNTEDERIVYDALLGRGGQPVPAAVVLLVDVQKFQQQLYLASQVVDLRLPTVLALSMGDRALRRGVEVRHERLADLMGVPVVPVHAGEGVGIDVIMEALGAAVGASGAGRQLHWRPSMGLADAYNHLDQTWIHRHLKLHTGARLIEGLRLLASPRAAEEYAAHEAHGVLEATLAEAREKMEARKENWTLSEVLQRHNWTGQIAGQVLAQGRPERWSDRMRLRIREAPSWMGWTAIGAALVLAWFVGRFFLGA